MPRTFKHQYSCELRGVSLKLLWHTMNLRKRKLLHIVIERPFYRQVARLSPETCQLPRQTTAPTCWRAEKLCIALHHEMWTHSDSPPLLETAWLQTRLAQHTALLLAAASAISETGFWLDWGFLSEMLPLSHRTLQAAQQGQIFILWELKHHFYMGLCWQAGPLLSDEYQFWHPDLTPWSPAYEAMTGK